jgi:hypothetical protein
MLLILILLSIVKTDCNQAYDHCDLVELNHFHDFQGRNVYDQVIFYEWSPEHSRYHVRSWMIVEDSSRLPKRNYSDGSYRTCYTDRDSKIDRVISSQHFRESWTQNDPERDNKRLLDERLRHSLIKRLSPKPSVSQLDHGHNNGY